MWKLTPRISIFWKLSSRLIGLCNFYFAKFLIIWEINFSNGRVYSRSNTLIKFIIIYYHVSCRIMASSFFDLISKQARPVCRCKRVLVTSYFIDVEYSSGYLFFICFWIDLVRVLATTGNMSAVVRPRFQRNYIIARDQKVIFMARYFRK